MLEQSWDFLMDPSILFDSKLKGLLIGDLLGYTDGKVLGPYEGINWDILMLKFLSLYLEMYMEQHLGLTLEQSWAH